MEIYCRASAGTLESSDAYVEIEPGSGAVDVQIQSVVADQFGTQIEAVVRQAAQEEGVDGACIQVKDGGGALDFAIRARVRCALRRAKGGAEG